MSEELKPCPNPWCTSGYAPFVKGYFGGGPWVAGCGCGVRAPVMPSRGEAITAWNTRSHPHVAQTDSLTGDELKDQNDE